MEDLLHAIRSCVVCAAHLPLGARPVLVASPAVRLLIVGQAPGTKVHASGIPWNDQSGVELRRWLDMDADTFYTHPYIGIVPMGFCYPGKGTSGDMPPRPECAPLWHPRLMDAMPHIALVLLIGQYAQRHYLGGRRQRNLTETVRNFRDHLDGTKVEKPYYFPLPHPSPRNRMWMRRNPWFETQVLPELRMRVQHLLGCRAVKQAPPS